MTAKEPIHAIHYHEAAHVVSCVVLNVPWKRAEVTREGHYLSGRTHFDGNPDEWEFMGDRRRAAIAALAGGWGEAIYRQGPAKWSKSDYSHAAAYVEDSGDSIARISLAAKNCCLRNWTAIRRVAEHLAAVGGITPMEARECLQF